MGRKGVTLRNHGQRNQGVLEEGVLIDRDVEVELGAVAVLSKCEGIHGQPGGRMRNVW